MKTIKKILLPLIAVAAFSSCDSYLDMQPLQIPATTEDIFATKESTRKALTMCYTWMEHSWGLTANADGGPWDGITDDIIPVWTKHQSDGMRKGLWHPGSVPYAQWTRAYRGIRDCTYFLQNEHLCKELDPEMRKQWRAEARFMRAYLYWTLLRLYGPITLMGETIHDYTEPFEKGREPFETCVDYIANEFYSAAQDLYVTNGSIAERGIPTKGAALGMRSRVLLFAASPLFNTDNSLFKGWKTRDGRDFMPSTYSKQKWQDAADAAKLVIDIPNYKLYEVLGPDEEIDVYKSLYGIHGLLVGSEWNSEILWGQIGADKNFIDRLLPSAWKSGWGGFAPTQSLVDKFAMKSGIYPITGYSDDDGRGRGLKPIVDPASGYEDNKMVENFKHPWDLVTKKTYSMYVDREPRFYANIIYDGMKMPANVNEDEYPNGTGVKYKFINYSNGGSSYNVSQSSKTGYGCRKYLSRQMDPDNDKFPKPIWSMIRLGEVYLNYVEALIEVGDLTNPDIWTYWNKIRKRAGVPDIEEVYPAVKTDQAEARKYIRREREIELCFELQRYFDVRRWQIAEKALNGPTYGLNISGKDGSKNNDGNIAFGGGFWTRKAVETCVFRSPQDYLYPIDQDEIDKNVMIEQSWGW